MSSAKVAVDCLGKDLDGDYAAFVDQHSDTTFYHSARYSSFLLNLLECQCNTLVAHSGDDIQGVMPLMSTTGSHGTVFNSLPFYGSYGGVLAASVEAAKALWMGYRDLLKGVNVCAGTVVVNPFCSDPDDYRDAPIGTIDRRMLQFSELHPVSEFPASLLAQIDGSSRRNIRKAERGGVTVVIDEGRMDFLANCHHDNMKKIGGKPKPRAFFDLLDKHFRPGHDYRLYVGQIDGEPISALLLFYYRDYVEYFVPVTINEYRNVQPMALILYRAMCDAAREGYRVWNWGGTWETQSGVYRFKKKWGAMERYYNYLVSVVDPEFLEDALQDELVSTYGNFYVVPFHLLKSEAKSIS